MPSSFPIPTLEETHALLVADHRNRIPEDDVSRTSDSWQRDRVLAAGVASLHAHSARVYDELLPDTAVGAQLARLSRGIERRPATAAHKSVALRVYGTGGAAVAVGDQLTHADGTVFQVNSLGVVSDPPGYMDVDILALTKGRSGRKRAGEVLRFSAPPVNITTEAMLQVNVDEAGEDEESEAAWSLRIIDRIQQPPMGGNAHDYQVWALEVDVDDIRFVGVYPGRNGLGSIDIALLRWGTGVLRTPGVDLNAAVESYINARRPITLKSFRVLRPLAMVQDVEVTVEAYEDVSYAFDWDDTAPPTVTGYNPGTRQLTMSARPGDMRAGHRLTFKNTVAPANGAELVVEVLGPGVNDVTITAASAPNVWPEGGVPIYAGGPLVEPIRLAILAHIDSLGTARGAWAADTIQWDDTVRRSIVNKAVLLQEGVRDAVVISPVANVAATDPAPSTLDINFIVARQVLVRKG